MQAKLLVAIEPGRELAIDLPSEGVILGRDTSLLALRPHCSADRKMSSKHCRVLLKDGRWLIEDLRSTNGTYVNEKLVQQKLLDHLEIIRIGSLAMRFCALEARVDPEQPAPAPPQPSANAEAIRLAHEFELLTARHTALLDEDQKLRQQLQAARRENESLKQKQEELNAALVNERGAATEVEKLHDEQRQAQATISALRAQISSLEVARREGQLAIQRLQSLNQQCERAHAERNQAVLLYTELRNEAEQLRQVVDERERLLSELKEGLHNHNLQLANLRQQLDQQQKSMGQVRAERDNAQKRIEDLQIQIQVSEVAKRELTQENQRLTTVVNSQMAGTAELSSAIKKAGKLESAIEELQGTRQRLIATVGGVYQAGQRPLAELRLQLINAQVARFHP